jgi:hypothetical protein
LAEVDLQLPEDPAELERWHQFVHHVRENPQAYGPNLDPIPLALWDVNGAFQQQPAGSVRSSAPPESPGPTPTQTESPHQGAGPSTGSTGSGPSQPLGYAQAIFHPDSHPDEEGAFDDMYDV